MKKYLIMIAALAACLFSIVSCSSDNGSSAAEENLKKGMEYLAENALLPTTTVRFLLVPRSSSTSSFFRCFDTMPFA